MWKAEDKSSVKPAGNTRKQFGLASLIMDSR